MALHQVREVLLLSQASIGIVFPDAEPYVTENLPTKLFFKEYTFKYTLFWSLSQVIFQKKAIYTNMAYFRYKRALANIF
jgi:hypothetical protein